MFNGCITTTRTCELIGLGRFLHSDTEGILRAWAEWGVDALPRFNGMFAFANYNATAHRLATRDRLGHAAVSGSAPGSLRFVTAGPLAAGGVDTRIDLVALHHYMHFHAVVPAFVYHLSRGW